VQSWLVSGTREVMQRAASLAALFSGRTGSLLVSRSCSSVVLFLRDGDTMIVRARRLIPMAEDRKERLFSH